MSAWVWASVRVSRVGSGVGEAVTVGVAVISGVGDGVGDAGGALEPTATSEPEGEAGEGDA